MKLWNKYRLYTEVKVSTRFIKPRAEGGTRFDKSSRDRTEVYNALQPCYIAMHFILQIARGNSIHNFTNLWIYIVWVSVTL